MDIAPEQDEQQTQDAPSAQLSLQAAILSDGQRAFAVNMAKGLSESDAYQAAFPSCRSTREAKNRGRKMARLPKIQEFLTALKTRSLDMADATVGKIELEMARIAFSDIRQLFDAEGEILPVHQWPDDAAHAVAGYEEKVGPGGTVLTRKLKLWDKPGTLATLADMRGMTNPVKDATQRATFSFNFALPPGARIRGKAGGRVIDAEPAKVADKPQESKA